MGLFRTAPHTKIPLWGRDIETFHHGTVWRQLAISAWLNVERKEQMTEPQKPHIGGEKANPEGNRSSQKRWGENNAKTVGRC